MAASGEFVIGIPVYDGVDLLDVTVPWELFNWMAQIEGDAPSGGRRKATVLVSADGDAVRTRDGLRLTVDMRLEESPDLDVLWVPGGAPVRLQVLMQDARFIRFLQAQSQNAQWVTSVCEGALLLAAAGLLDGYRATTHWAFIPCLALFPNIRVANGFPRYVVDRNRVTGGGVSAGLDEGLQLVSLLAGDIVARKVQLNIQYHPDPPFDDGDPSTAKPPVYNPGDNSTCTIPGMAETIDRIVRCA
jgi:transcriptional regulator GlxA family with amidase domain